MLCCEITTHFCPKELNLWLLPGTCTPSILLDFLHISLRGSQLCNRSAATRLQSSHGQKKPNWIQEKTKARFFSSRMRNEMLGGDLHGDVHLQVWSLYIFHPRLRMKQRCPVGLSGFRGREGVFGENLLSRAGSWRAGFRSRPAISQHFSA